MISTTTPHRPHLDAEPLVDPVLLSEAELRAAPTGVEHHQ
jgi:hypothetical protein